jgi:hypothetical protein
MNFEKKTAIIFGKGPTFRNDLIKNNDELFITINESTNFIDQPDILVVNDVEKFDKVELEKFNDIKLIIIPYYPHINKIPNYNYNWKKIKDKVSDYYKGGWYVYNLKSSKYKIEGIPNFNSYLTSSNTAVEWCCLNNIKNIKTYGIGMESGGYNSIFEKNFNHDSLKIKNEIKNRCMNYNVTLNMF